MEVLFRATDGGMPFNRKVLKFITFHLESAADSYSDDIKVYSCNDFGNVYSELDDYILSGSALTHITGLGDVERDRVARVAFSPKRAHGTWFSIKLTAETNKADFAINRLVYTIASLRTRGVAEATQTR